MNTCTSGKSVRKPSATATAFQTLPGCSPCISRCVECSGVRDSPESAACLKINEDEDSPEEEHENLYCFDRSQTSQRFSGLPYGLVYLASPAHGFSIVPPFTPQT